jgi:hypothetical protein
MSDAEVAVRIVRLDLGDLLPAPAEVAGVVFPLVSASTGLNVETSR